MKIKSLTSLQISSIINQGSAYNSGSFLLKVIKTTQNNNLKASFLIPKKIFKKAVERNRVKRRLKSSLYSFLKEYNVNLNKNYLNSNFFIFIAKKTAINVDFKILVSEVKQIFIKQDIIQK